VLQAVGRGEAPARLAAAPADDWAMPDSVIRPNLPIHSQSGSACGCGGLPGGELVGDERLDVLASRLLKPDASGREEPGGRPERVKLGLDCAVGLVLSLEMRLEGAHQVGYAGVGQDRTVPRTRVESGALEP
jgi:hypothetical protein